MKQLKELKEGEYYLDRVGIQYFIGNVGRESCLYQFRDGVFTNFQSGSKFKPIIGLGRRGVFDTLDITSLVMLKNVHVKDLKGYLISCIKEKAKREARGIRSFGVCAH
jgi:hypothetical protein